MSDEQSLGFLLLRDGHAIPLQGISPDEVKQGSKHHVRNPDAERLRHKRTLNAIVDRLGFHGDFGDFKHAGWPEFQAFLIRHGCTHRAGLFPSDHEGCIDLFFNSAFGPTRRQLADRFFESRGVASIPKKVFLGYGVDWKAWDRGDGHTPPKEAIATVGGDKATARQRAWDLFTRRLDLAGQWGFLDSKLIWGPVEQVIDKTYFPNEEALQQKEEWRRRLTEAVQAFRAIFDASPEGWVEVLPFNSRLAVLKAHDGAWDVLWRCYRAEEPPKPSDISSWSHLAVEDLPSGLMSMSDLRRSIHFRQEVWEEREAHEAEQAFYDRGGSAQEHQLTSDADVRVAWLREQGILSAPERLTWTGEVPLGFSIVETNGGRLAVSELVDLATFRRMLVETGYLERRVSTTEPWERANEGVDDDAPVGASWADAQAFCAWKERQLGVAVRLPRKDELRSLRPFYSKRYTNMAGIDFPWENWPPRPIIDQAADGTEQRHNLPSAVAWSEPRFKEPGPDLPEFPHPSGWSSRPSRKRWISNFPPAAPWCKSLPWSEYHGLRFIDAWDAYEWCQEAEWASGRFWEGRIGTTSWGAYKNVKIMFRLVLDLEV